MKPSCICNEVFQFQHPRCEPGMEYLCKHHSRDTSPSFILGGVDVSREQAVKAACRILANANYPLITGLNVIGARSISTAIAIARHCRAVIDAGIYAANATSSLVREGFVTATLGEMVQRCDRLLLIDCDPLATHPRCFRQIVENGKRPEVAAFGPFNGDADLSITGRISFDSNCLESDLMLLQSMLMKAPVGRRISAAKIQRLRRLADWMLSGNYLVLLTGQVSSSCLDTVTAICRQLNNHIKAVALNLRSDANSVGAESGLTAATGFPRAIDFSSGCAQSYGDEFSTTAVLSRGELDAILTFDADVMPLVPGNVAAIVFNTVPNSLHPHQDHAFALPPGKAPRLTIAYLDVWGDYFHRLDDLSFAVSSQAAEGQSVPSFLADILENLGPPPSGTVPNSNVSD